jgi:FkbM family methyltransferase
MTSKTPCFALKAIFPTVLGVVQREWPLLRERGNFALFDKFNPINVDGYLIDNPSKLLCFFNQVYENRFGKRWSHLLPARPTILDIGANYGVMGWLYRRRWPRATIIGIEPIKEAAECCLASDVYDDVQTVGLSNRAGDTTLHLTKSRGVTASMNSGYYNEETRTIKTVLLDDILKDTRFDFIKCDVDGAELMVVEGGIKHFKECGAAVIECASGAVAQNIARLIGKEAEHLDGEDYLFH